MTKTIEEMISDIEKIDDQIFEINQTIADKVASLNKKKEDIKKSLDEEVSKIAIVELKDKDYGCGTANIETDRYKVKVTVSKKIKWDQSALRNVANQISVAGQDPEDFIKYKLSVSETDYKKFPDEIQKAFEPARTVEPSVPTVKIERKV